MEIYFLILGIFLLIVLCFIDRSLDTINKTLEDIRDGKKINR